MLGRAAELEDDASIGRKLVQQSFRQRVIVAADEGGMGGRRIGLAVVIACCGVEHDKRCHTGRRETLKRLRMPREGLQMLQQHDIGERLGTEPLDDLISVPDRDHGRPGLGSQPRGWGETMKPDFAATSS